MQVPFSPSNINSFSLANQSQIMGCKKIARRVLCLKIHSSAGHPGLIDSKGIVYFIDLICILSKFIRVFFKIRHLNRKLRKADET